MDNKDIKKLEEIIERNGDCLIILCDICPLYKICSSYNNTWHKDLKLIRFNEAKKLLRKLKLERILKYE
jgi:hypothetical protein